MDKPLRTPITLLQAVTSMVSAARRCSKKPGVRSLNGLNLVGVRIKALMQSKEHDIILPKWITDCVKAQDIITISPK
jgi:hypothetical protein